MRISAIVKTKNGGEKRLRRKIKLDNIFKVFDDIEDIITRDIKTIRVILYDNNNNTIFPLSAIASDNFDWIGLAYMVVYIQHNIILGE